MKNLISLVLVFVWTSANAQTSEIKITSSNGVVISQSKDEFSGRSEYSSPVTEFRSKGVHRGFFLVGKVSSPNVTTNATIQGSVLYSGDWHHYTSAIFKGGEPAKFSNIGKEVISCRYECSYTETFIITPTEEQIAKYTEGEILPIQIRGSSSSYTFIINVPISYIKALNEVSQN